MSRQVSPSPLLLQLLLSLSLLHAAAASACSPGYSLLNDSAGPPTCLSPVSNQSANICDALDACAKLGHRLLTPSTYVRVRSQPQFAASSIHIGVTDSLRERDRSRDGWQEMPGLQNMTLTDSSWWSTEEPGNQGDNQNCVFHNSETGKLHDVGCWSPARYHCEHPAGQCVGGAGGPRCVPLHNANFQRADILAYSQTGPGCSQLISVGNLVGNAETACALACKLRLGCVGFYSNDMRKQCVLLPHFDATVDLAYSSDAEKAAWRKLVSSDLANWA